MQTVVADSLSCCRDRKIQLICITMGFHERFQCDCKNRIANETTCFDDRLHMYQPARCLALNTFGNLHVTCKC